MDIHPTIAPEFEKFLDERGLGLHLEDGLITIQDLPTADPEWVKKFNSQDLHAT
jgi:hypothetical protein